MTVSATSTNGLAISTTKVAVVEAPTARLPTANSHVVPIRPPSLPPDSTVTLADDKGSVITKLCKSLLPVFVTVNVYVTTSPGAAWRRSTWLRPTLVNVTVRTAFTSIFVPGGAVSSGCVGVVLSTGGQDGTV